MGASTTWLKALYRYAVSSKEALFRSRTEPHRQWRFWTHGRNIDTLGRDESHNRGLGHGMHHDKKPVYCCADRGHSLQPAVADTFGRESI